MQLVVSVVPALEVQRKSDCPHIASAAPRRTVERVDALVTADAVTVIDIRNPGEPEAGTIPGSFSIPLAQLRVRLDEVSDDKPMQNVPGRGGGSSAFTRSYMDEARSDGERLERLLIPRAPRGSGRR